MSSVLPPFIDLLAFDFAARHGSFTRAARDLNVSQPAISRRVAALEADLRVLLFSRDTKPLRLTPMGQQLFDVLRSGLSRLEATVTEMRKLPEGKKLTLAAAPGFLAYWLVPRLSELAASFPDHELRLVTGDQSSYVPEADLHVRFGNGDWPSVRAVKILGEEVFAVCSPGFFSGSQTFLNLDDLKISRLLQLTDGLERGYDWQSWFEAVGTSIPKKLETIDFDNYNLLVGAALAGQGIALCWSGLLDQYLETGALVQVSRETLVSDRGYFATYPSMSERSEVERLAAWLGEHGTTVAR